MIEKPIFIIGCPRSGTTLLYYMLSMVPTLWSIGYESKEIIEKYHHPSVKSWSSGALDTSDLTELSKHYIRSEFEIQSASGNFWKQVNNIRNFLRHTQIISYIKTRSRSKSQGSAISSKLPQQSLNIVRSYVRFRNTILPFLLPEKIQLLEKTPENCLRLPFLFELFQDGRIIYLIRDGRSNVYSLMEGWRQPHLFPGYQIPEKVSIPGDTRGRWAFTLIPGWRDLLDLPLEEVCAWQWFYCNQAVVDFLDKKGKAIPSIQIKYEDLIMNTNRTMGKIADFLGSSLINIFPNNKLPDINVVSRPDFEKWKKNQDEIERVVPIMKSLMEKFGYI